MTAPAIWRLSCYNGSGAPVSGTVTGRPWYVDPSTGKRVYGAEVTLLTLSSLADATAQASAVEQDETAAGWLGWDCVVNITTGTGGNLVIFYLESKVGGTYQGPQAGVPVHSIIPANATAVPAVAERQFYL